MVSSLRDEGRLRGMERLVESSSPESFGEAFPRSQLYCLLDDLPDHLTPEHSLRHWVGGESSQQLIVNPNCCFPPDDDVPLGAGADLGLLHNFAVARDFVWVREPGSELLLPFWMGAKLRYLSAQLKPGEPAPKALPPETELALRIAGVLVPEDWVSARHQEWLAATSRSAETFRRNGYVPLPYLLHPFQVAALRRYYRHMIRSGGMDYGDRQTARRFFVHNESVARFFHHQLTTSVSALVGEAAKPSYVYVGSYDNCATLPQHTDREQCEFSISLCLDYSPEPRAGTPWPLQLHTTAGRTKVFQALGDGLLYRGHQLLHSRDPLPLGHTSTSIFFHYVPQDFSGPLD